MSTRAALAGLIARTLEFRWYDGACTVIGSHTTGWRDSPNAGMVQIHGLRTRIDLPGRTAQWAEPGDALLIDATLHHCLTSSQVAPAPLCRWASCDWLLFGGISALSLFEVPMIQRGALAQHIGESCERLARLSRSDDATDPIRPVVDRTAWGMGVLSAVIAERPLQPHALQLLTHAERLQPVLRHIEERLAAPTDRGSLARLARLSPSRFHDLFLQVMRQSPMAYLTRRRMQRAQQLLLTTAQPVQGIAQQVGFEDAFHFSRVFRRSTGQSPRSYRSQGRTWLAPTPGSSAPT